MRPVRFAAPLLAAAVLAAPHALAQDKGNPIAEQVKASLKDPTKPFTMLVLLETKEGTGDKFEAAFTKAVGPTRKEKGCLAYDLNRDTKATTKYVLYERWQNLASLEAHLNAPHITTLLKEVGDLLAGPPEVKVLLPAA